MRQKILIHYSNLVCEKSYDPVHDQYQCNHCHDWFPRNEVCPDHFPVTKGHDVKIKFDTEAAVTSCKDCNRSDNPSRK